MPDIGVDESRVTLVVLEPPTNEVIAGKLLEVAVRDASRIVRLMDRHAVAGDEQCILNRQAFDVVAVA